MLIFSCEVNESLTIRDDIKVKVLGIKNSKVIIGFALPAQISVEAKENPKKSQYIFDKNLSDDYLRNYTSHIQQIINPFLGGK